MTIPPTPRRPVTNAYHGVAVVDDYRWLEDPSDPDVAAWSTLQNAAARSYLDGLPSLPLLRERIRHLLGDSPRYVPTKHAGGYLFAFKFQPPLQQNLLVAIADPDDLASERVVVDPNAIDPTGATAIDWFVPSLDGRLVAVSLSTGGTEDGTLHVFDVETGVETGDVIPRVQYGTAGGSVAWLEGSTSFFYTRYPHHGERDEADLNFHQQVWRHELGRPVAEDRYSIGREFPRIAEVELTSSGDGMRVFARVAHGDGGDAECWLWSAGWNRLSTPDEGVVGGMFGPDGALWLRSLAGAPNGRILRLPPDRPSLAHAQVVLPEASGSVAGWTVTSSRLYVVYIEGGPSTLLAFDHAGRPVATATTPPVSTVGALVRTADDEVIFGSVSYVVPEAFHRWTAGTGENRATAIRMSSRADLSDVTVTREFAVSRDGTRIPMSILRPGGTGRDGRTPTLLYGYGGFGISLVPSFNPALLAWLEQGGSYVVANIRGGGEYGDAWHRAGNLTRKQNVFDDFIACAEHLVGAGYTTPDRLAIMGASNGGLLMGAVLTQRPELFRAVSCDVGVLDGLRVELDDNGAFNVTEFGSTDDPAQFAAMYACSPYHRVRDGVAYPAVLLSSGANDPRVEPYHSRKMAARLQAASTSGRPVLLRTTDKAGHGMGSSLDETVNLKADQFAFLLEQLGVAVRPGGGVSDVRLMPPAAAAESPFPLGAVTFLFTDIEGSTALWEQSPAAMQVALARHDAILRDGIEKHGGQVFKTAGDAFYAAFAQPSQGLAAALSLQRALLAEAWPPTTPIRVRMALHSGEAQWRHGDYFGPPLNLVARLLSVSRGGQTLLSAAAGAALGDAPIAGAQVESHGHYRLKGVETPVEVWELGAQGSGAFAPPADTDHVYRVVRKGELWQPVRAIRNNLPAERDAFVGRTLELHALALRLDNGARLTTVLGPGGAGKTRFVRRYGSAWLGDWPGGVCFCDLSDARSLEGIMGAVAVALDVPLSNADAGVQLGHAIAARGRCLVVLDNFEHLLEHAAATVGLWIERAADAAFVVTSRERLHLPGEEVFLLEPLPLDKDAIDLFVARAQAQRPDFALSATNREDVGRIVRLLDGLPLAIELAAARVRVLSPAQLVERMRDRFALLAGARGAVARQATLRAAIDWSWDLLAPWEQAALAQCAVFEGGFTLELAEQVIDLSAWPEALPAMDAVQALVDKSLLRTWAPAGESRYDLDELYFGMYVSIHEYAGEKLRARGPAAERAAEERHGRCFAAFGADAAVEALYRRDGTRRRRALALELDNIVAACRRAVARADGETAVATYRAAWEVLDLQGPFDLSAALGAQVLGLASLDLHQRTMASLTRARTLHRAGKLAQARSLLEQTLALAHQAGDRRLEAIARSNLGNLLCSQGRMDEARQHLETALAMQRELGNGRTEGSILNNLGRLHVDQGRVEQGRKYYDQALAIQRELGNRIEEASVLSQIAVHLGEAGRLPEARAHFEESLAISQELGDRVAEGEALNNLGCLHHDQGRLDEARSAYEQALAMHREVGNRRFEGYALGDLGRLHREQGRWADARACLEQALAIARETADRRIEGSELLNLGELFLLQGHADGAAQEVFAQAESVLREVGDKHYLALLLCGRAELERRGGDPVAARATCAEAQSLAAETRAGPDSELGRKIAALDTALA